MAALVLIAASVFAVPKGEPPAPKTVSPEAFAKASPEHKIALLDAREWVEPTDRRVTEARRLLFRVDAKYPEDPAAIVKLVELFWKAILAAEVDVSATEILEGSVIWPAADGKREFSEFVVLYATLREHGLNHTAALKKLKTKGR